MIESSRPKVNRFKYAAMLLGAVAVAATPLAYPATATAEREWDVVAYDQCIKDHPASVYNCCYKTGGEWSGDDVTGKCVAPPANQDISHPPAPNRGLRSAPPTAANPAP